MNDAKGIIKVSITDNSYYSVYVFTHVYSSEAGSKPKCHMDEKMTSSGCTTVTLGATSPQESLASRAVGSHLAFMSGLLPPQARLSRKSRDMRRGCLGVIAESATVFMATPQTDPILCAEAKPSSQEDRVRCNPTSS